MHQAFRITPSSLHTQSAVSSFIEEQIVVIISIMMMQKVKKWSRL